MEQSYNNIDKKKLTYQQRLSKQDIKDKLKDYKKIINISNVPIGTHIRYFTNIDKEQVFRLGGQLNKIDSENRFITLSNGKINWSVQLKSATLFQKMTDDEIKEEMKEEIKKEILNTDIENNNSELIDLKNENKKLKKKLENLKDYEIKYNDLLNTNKLLNNQLQKIKEEIKKKKINN